MSPARYSAERSTFIALFQNFRHGPQSSSAKTVSNGTLRGSPTAPPLHARTVRPPTCTARCTRRGGISARFVIPTVTSICEKPPANRPCLRCQQATCPWRGCPRVLALIPPIGASINDSRCEATTRPFQMLHSAAKNCQGQRALLHVDATSPWPLARLNSPSVTEAGSAHARVWIDGQSPGMGAASGHSTPMTRRQPARSRCGQGVGGEPGKIRARNWAVPLVDEDGSHR